MKPTKHKFTTLKQVMDNIPGYLVPKLATEHSVDKKSRSISPWSHVVSLVYAQLAHALSLNDVCDSLRNHSSALFTVRRATPPSRNGLSHANKVRNADMAEDLFWQVLEHYKTLCPKFGSSTKAFKVPRRFKRVINLVDSTTIKLVSGCMDWAKHRRRKAAAKCHMRLDAHSYLPRFALVKSAKSHDSQEAIELCAGIQAGEIVVFDKAYIDYSHLFTLNQRGVFWVSRAKDNMRYKSVKKRKVKKNTNILLDAEIKLTGLKALNDYSQRFRLIRAIVEINGKSTEMEFITNNMEWAAGSICELYKSRWGIESFFKQLKQTLQLSDFLGYSENAVRWQIWTALLTYVILRFIAFMNRWKGSFPRFFTVVRGVLWNRFHLENVLARCGTANRHTRMVNQPYQLYLPGIL
ncbi:MAG: IS4 family transposase [Chitinivibrionales bacterium]|nr:IS4 family transposase [Chitinivibrionales bacterium]